MKCPKCDRPLIKRRNYAPTTGFYPGFTWSHEYSLSEVFGGNICTHVIMEGSS